MSEAERDAVASDPWRELDVVISRWALKKADGNALADAAVSALASGCETPSLIRLATMEDATWSEFPPVVNELFRERGLLAPGPDEAIKIVGDDLLRQMVVGELDIRTATNELYRLAADLWERPGYADLQGFIGLDDAFDCAEHGISGDPKQVEEDALSYAKELLAKGGVRVA